MDIDDIKAEDMTALQAQGYTEQDLAMLAPTEVAALLAPESDDSTGGADHDAAAAEQDEAVAAAAKTAAAVEPDAAALAAAKATETVNAEAAAAAGDVEEGEAKPFSPTFKVEVPADAKEQIAALRTEHDEAFGKLMAGEIEAADYKAIKNRTDDAIDDLKTKALTASIFQQANEQTQDQIAANEWKTAERAAFEGFKSQGLDYQAKPALMAAYNTHLKALGNDPKNERRDAPWFLAEANRLTRADLGLPAAAAKKGADPARNRVDLSELPPTLRGVPAAATGAIGADEFAHLRNLDGLELERAHAKLTPEQRDRWMNE